MNHWIHTTVRIAAVTALALSAALCGSAAAPAAETPGPLRVLLLTGENNHDWKTTTPIIRAVLEAGGRFAVTEEHRVEAMKADAFAGFDLVLGNFNAWKRRNEAGAIWGPAVREAFLAHIRAGHGLVIVHAGSSVFYDWPEFQQLAGTSWGKTTSHGRVHESEVRIADPDHPITRGLRPFVTRDEFWQGLVLAPGTRVLATVTPDPAHKGSGRPEPTAMVTTLGRGRGFTLMLGHDAKAMESPGFRELLRRGAEWAATGRVGADR